MCTCPAWYVLVVQSSFNIISLSLCLSLLILSFRSFINSSDYVLFQSVFFPVCSMPGPLLLMINLSYPTPLDSPCLFSFFCHVPSWNILAPPTSLSVSCQSKSGSSSSALKPQSVAPFWRPHTVLSGSLDGLPDFVAPLPQEALQDPRPIQTWYRALTDVAFN